MSKHSPAASLLTTVLSTAVIGCGVIIAVLSLLPAQEMLHTGITKGVDHFIAYCGTGALMAMAFRARRRLVVAGGLGLVALSGLMELLQRLSPGRTPMLSDFLMSSGGALTGLAMGVITILLMRYVRYKLYFEFYVFRS